MKIDDVAELLQVKKSTIYALVHQKKIPYIKLSHKILRFKRSEIEAWLNEAHQECTAKRQPARRRSPDKAGGGKYTENLVDDVLHAAMNEVLGS